LGNIKSVESAPVLLILLDEKINDDPQQMWQAQNLKNNVLYALGNIAEPATVPVLLDHAIIKETAMASINALRTMGKVAAPALIDALNSDNPEKKQVAISAIGGTGATEAVPALIKIAEDKANLLTAISAVRAMGELKYNGATVADLDKYLDMLTEGAKSADAKMVNESIRTIGMIKSDKAVGILSALKTANPQLSNQIYQALGQQATTTAVNTLITFKNEATDVNVKNQIINIIGRTGNISAMPSLLEDLNNPALKASAQYAIKLLSGEVDEKSSDGISGRMPRTNRENFGNGLYGFGDATKTTPGGWGQGDGQIHR
jgi:HEAT repeat protein